MLKNNIEIIGNLAYLRGQFNPELISKLDDDLSYFPLGYEFSPKWKLGLWDGKIRLLNNNLTFAAGLTQRVQEFFEDKGVSMPIYDRNKPIKRVPNDISENLIEIKKSPREYQQRATDVALKEKRGIIRIATGGGKTLVAAMVVAEVGGSAIIYVIGKDLLHQFHDFFEKVFKTEIGIVGDGIFDVKPITIASVWSVGQAFGMKSKKNANDDEKDNEKAVSSEHHDKIRKMVANANVSILDECHLGAAETIQRISRAIRSEYILGMSASPYRDDNADMLIEAIFGKIIIEITASELIKAGYLVAPKIRFIRVPKMLYPSTKYKEIYKEYIVENAVRNNIIVGKMSSKVRAAVVDEVIEGKCKLILCSSIFDIGVDVPILSGLVLAGGGKSSVRTLQRIGRSIRIAGPGKKFAAVLEFFDDVKYLKDHSKRRREIYELEPGFEVEWVKRAKKKKT
jgi:superfamily II DNA or RNA helicase